MSSRLVRSAFGSSATSVWLAVVALATTPYLLHRLGEAAYGIFALLAVTSAHLSNLDLGFGHATVRFVARARAQRRPELESEFIDSSFFIFLIAASAGSAVLVLGAQALVDRLFHVPPHLRRDAIACFRIGGLTFLCSSLSSLFSAVLQGLERFAWLNWSRTVLGAVSSLASVLVVFRGGGVVAVFTAQLAVAFLGCLVLGIVTGVLRGRSPRPSPSRAALVEMWPYALLTLTAGVAYQWMINGPSIVLAASVSTSQLPAFSIPQSLFQRLTMLVSAVSLVFLPFASAVAAEPGSPKLRPAFFAHVRLTILTFGPMVAILAVFGRDLLAVWIDPAFAADAAATVSLFAAAALAAALSAPAADVARGLGRPSWVLAFTGFVAVVASLLSLLVVRSSGGTGVAAAFLVAIAAGAAGLVAAVARQLLGAPLVEVAREAGPPALAVSLLAVVLTLARLGLELASASLAALLLLATYVVAAQGLLLRAGERRALQEALGVSSFKARAP